MTTVANFVAWEQLATKMTNDMLIHAIKDCREAEVAMQGWNPDKEAYYSDQAATYADALRKRTQKRGR